MHVAQYIKEHNLAVQQLFGSTVFYAQLGATGAIEARISGTLAYYQNDTGSFVSTENVVTIWNVSSRYLDIT